MALREEIKYFTLFVAILFGFIGIASMLMPLFRIRGINKKIKNILTTEDEIEDIQEEKSEVGTIVSRLEYD